MSAGIIYIASGKKYVKEACQAAASVKAHMPDVPIALFADEAVSDPHVDRHVSIDKPQSGFGDKVSYMLQSPFERTIFLDTDTYLCADISELFNLLDRYDLAAAQGAIAFHQSLDTVPDCFPELNTGVIVYRQSPAVAALFQTWADLYHRDRERIKSWYCPDQPPFREALYSHPDIKLAVLHGEYNCRFIYPTRVAGTVKILHGRHPHLPAIAAEINQTQRLRLFLPDLGVLTLKDKRPLLSLIWQKLQRKFKRPSASQPASK